MQIVDNLDVFLRPKAVAVVGASERSGSWGSYIMQALLTRKYPGKIYPINRHAEKIYNIPTFKEVKDVDDSIDLAFLTISEQLVEKAIAECGKKQVRGIVIVTAGFSEALENGRDRERALTELAHAHGIRLLGPNVGGIFNLHAEFNGSAAPAQRLLCTNLAAISQCGYGFYGLIASGFSRKMGVGKFVHTGNECDLTVTDFLEYFGHDPDVKGIVMYLEALRDGRRFLEVARKVSKTKPIVVYKAGRTRGAARAAQSHTGALSAANEIYEGLFVQAGVIASPTMELLLPLGHALIERPPMRGKRVGIITMGGSWGVALTDSLEELGLIVPELTQELQKTLRSIGMPFWASTKNPIDIGASGLILKVDSLLALGREILSSGEVDALILHGMGRPGMLEKDATNTLRLFLDINKEVVRRYVEMEKEKNIPVLIGSAYSPWESQIVHDLNEQGIRIYNRIDETAQLLSSMHTAWRRRKGGNDY